ncbi:MAG TPA: hypothetical protein VJ815_06050 [Acidimicrobiia bacterium]|nr:hypothetical protein [Acidimicrobiia bacterium]
MNTDLTGTVRMAGETQTGIRVEIHLDRETMSLVSPYGELGTWPLSGMGIASRVDGFHLKVEGEELVLSTSDDVAFALAVGIRSTTSPRLNRQLAHARDGGIDVEERLAPPTPEVRIFAPESHLPAPNVAPLAITMMAAAGGLVLAAIQALTSDSSLRVFGAVPIWPFWLLAAIGLGMGGITLLNRMPHGRKLVAAGALIGLVGLGGSLLSIGSPNFSWLGDGVFLGGTGTILALLLWGVDLLNQAE